MVDAKLNHTPTQTFNAKPKFSPTNREMADTHVRGRISNSMPNPLDRYFGKRMRLRREVLQLTQMELAQNLGITFQQIQKYEKGANRVGWSRACDIADVLGTSLDYFRTGIEPEDLAQSPMRLYQKRKKMPVCPPLKLKADPMTSTETLELVEAYYSINNREIAKSLFHLLRNMSHSNSTMPG